MKSLSNKADKKQLEKDYLAEMKIREQQVIGGFRKLIKFLWWIITSSKRLYYFQILILAGMASRFAFRAAEEIDKKNLPSTFELYGWKL